MEIASYQCRACKYVLSDPVDVCPVCNAHFYWMLIPHKSPDNKEIDHFISEMNVVVGGQTNRTFLTHGEHFWLPHTFWSCDPEGKSLSRFAWIADVRFMQHESEEQRLDHKRQGANPNPWDTNPGIAVADVAPELISHDGEELVVLDDEPRPDARPITLATVHNQSWPDSAGIVVEEDQLLGDTAPHPTVQPPASVGFDEIGALDESVFSESPKSEGAMTAKSTAPVSAPKPLTRMRRKQPPPATPRSRKAVWFLPVMLFLFFILLSLSWLVLLYYRNTRPLPENVVSERIIDSPEVEIHGNKILS